MTLTILVLLLLAKDYYRWFFRQVDAITTNLAVLGQKER